MIDPPDRSAPSDELSTSLNSAKRALRLEIRARVRRMPPEQRAEASAQARQLLVQQSPWRTARCVLFFAPLDDELDLWPLVATALAAGKSVALPRFESASQSYGPCQISDPEQDLRAGRFGILEPDRNCAELPLNRLDFVLVPGVAFDARGCRLGRGRGYYDRLLHAVQGVTCGAAFDEQIVRHLPLGPHDVNVKCILTPTRWIEP